LQNTTGWLVSNFYGNISQEKTYNMCQILINNASNYDISVKLKYMSLKKINTFIRTACLDRRWSSSDFLLIKIAKS